MLHRDNYSHENASDICGKISSRPQQQQQQQHHQQHQQQHQNRSKPAVPAKPTNIPPVPVQQFYKDPSIATVASPPATSTAILSTVPSTNTKYINKLSNTTAEMQRNIGCDYPALGATTKPSKCDVSVPTSPNMSFGNDCCGMLLSSSSKLHQNETPSNNGGCHHPHNHYNNNNNNNGSDECGGGATSCIGTASNKLVHSLNCGIKHSSTDSVDGCSSVSSHSGGFRDPDYILRQQAAYTLANITSNAGGAENGGKLVASPAKKQSMQKLQFNQTTKQIEQILAQRLATSSSSSTSSSTSVISVTAATGTTTSSAVAANTNQTTIVTASVLPSVSNTSITSTAGASVSLNKKRMFSSCYSSTDGATTTGAGVATNQGIDTATNLTMSLNISKQLQNKLQEEMKQQCKIIQEKHLIEKRPPQQNYKPITTEDLMSNRSQPAIGLKQTPKARANKPGDEGEMPVVSTWKGGKRVPNKPEVVEHENEVKIPPLIRVTVGLRLTIM